MANPAWLESSLRRSGRLGLEVLERASGRCVDWTSTGASQTPTASDEITHPTVKRTRSELDDAFATITEFMAQTTRRCKVSSGLSTDYSAVLHEPSCPQGHVSSAKEDFYIEVSPGTYAVTASLPESQQQTHLVRVKAGESFQLTFNL
ncbi:A-kinase interacting protein 1 [Nothobranchius furzeri]|uniref:A-kinase interacting protein 1 n=1 Tax=Nothobranchius furzeri TaxID=105023 RepID=A0A9D2YNQ7_NOTFU|nr:A-kinase interacting protein 1 [Nothobranchius furzeri]